MEHSHPSVEFVIEKIRIMNQIRNKATLTRERANIIVSNTISNIKQEDVVTILPNLTSMCDSITRVRNKCIGFVKSEILDIPNVLKFDLHGDLFCQYDSGVKNNSRYVILFSSFKQSIIHNVKVILVDGTFRTAPHGFYQVVVIHGCVLGKYYPLVYILMTNKTESLYKSAFHKVLKLTLMRPEFIITDFERALINAIEACFNDSLKYGCLFHYTQAIWKRIAGLGSITEYKNNSQFKKCVRYIMHLSFVPVIDVPKFYNLIRKKIYEEKFDSLINFCEYFEKVYVGEIDDLNNIVKPPIYDIRFWNVFDRIKKNLPRTSNGAETWNRIFNSRTEIPHPNIARFINELFQIEDANKFNITRAKNGVFIFSKSDLIKEKKLAVCVENYEMFSKLEYLDLVESIMDFKLNEE